MKFLLFSSFLFLLHCFGGHLSRQEKYAAKNQVIKNFAIFLFIFLYVALVRKTTFAATWSFTKKTATFTVTADEISFEQDDNNYYFTFNTSSNPYGFVSNTGFVVSQRSDLDYLNHTTTTGSSGSTYKTVYKAAGESVSLGTFSVTPKAGDVILLSEYPSFYVFDKSVTSAFGIDGTSKRHTDVCMITTEKFSKFQIPKSKINLFRYINFFGTKEYSGNASTSLRYGLSNAVDLISIVDHECNFKVRYLDASYHDYYCDICHWAKDKKEHTFDLEDIFGYSNRKCECGLHDKVTIRLSQESTDGKNISNGDPIDFTDTYKKIEHKDIIGSPNSQFDLGDINVNEKPGYIFLGLDPPLPEVFPNESIEYKLIYEPIKYKVLYSHDNLSKIERWRLAKSLISKGTARNLANGEINEIEEEYNISLSGLVYCMIQDCIYDREFSLPVYRISDYEHTGWGRIENNFYPLYIPSAPVKNITTKNNDVIVLNPVFLLKNNSGGSETWNGDSGTSREDGDSDIIHHGDGGGPGGGGSGGGGGGGGSSSGSNTNNTSDETIASGEGNAGTNNESGETGKDENNKEDSDKNGSDKNLDNDKTDKEGTVFDDKGDGDGGPDGEKSSGAGGENGSSDSNLANRFYNFKNLHLLSTYELDSYLRNLRRIDEVRDAKGINKNSFLEALSDAAFAKNFSKYLEQENLRLKILKRQALVSITKTILEKALYFLLLLFIILLIWDIKHKQKVKKYI